MSTVLTFNLIHFPEIDSTNLHARREIAVLASGTVIVADRQSQGRGRHGRSWHSPPGGNLYASLILKSHACALDFTLVPRLMALAIHAAVNEIGVNNCWIKWPNDIMVADRKLAGLLCEQTSLPHGEETLIVGFGVNLNLTAEQMTAIDQPATSVFSETQTTICPLEFLQQILAFFDEFGYLAAQDDGEEEIQRRWKQSSRLLGKTVRLHDLHDGDIVGTVIDLEKDGSLVIVLPSGKQQRFISGTVSLRWERTDRQKEQ